VEPTPPSVLIVDDDGCMRDCLAELLQRDGMAVATASDGDEALDLLESREFDALISDIQMPKMNGMELLKIVRESWPELPVLMMTAFAGMHAVVEVLREGAFDFLPKPFRGEIVSAAVHRAVQVRRLRSENEQLRSDGPEEVARCGLVGNSQAMQRVHRLIGKVANRECNVLITGESGTGKEMVARAIHDLGPRANGPFVAINCAAMPSELLESELFGHVRGAFTGAHQARVGLFGAANQGTLFLDEIGDMDQSLQAKLLRVLQDRAVRPVGGVKPEQIDVRIVSATHRDLRDEVNRERFRLDLFYRLDVVRIHLPALRERPEDIEPIARELLRRHGGAHAPKLTRAAIRFLSKQTWSGNVRELENRIERALTICEGTQLLPSHFQLRAATLNRSVELGEWLTEAADKGMSLKQLTDEYIERVLRVTSGHKSAASKLLGINRRTLYRWECEHLRRPGHPHSKADSAESARTRHG